MKSRWIKQFLASCALFASLYLILLIPDSVPSVPEAGEREPFTWNQDEYWSRLEARFKALRSEDCTCLSPRILSGFAEIESLLTLLQSDTLKPEAPLFTDVEGSFFELGTLLGVCPERLMDYVKIFGLIRMAVKDQSVHWDMNSAAARDRIYRVQYGGRTAIEEVMMQSPGNTIPEAVPESHESSATPSARILGVTIHSGDILVSRGGAPTSALIARGNDYPGNFSHAALAHVDSTTGKISIIEAHIESGVVISTVEDYLEDTKLRIMVLRLRSDLPAIQSDPMLPHKAAEYARRKATTTHTPYDFAMDFRDHSKLFCSEVVSEAYEQVGIGLWMGVSYISNRGIKSWLTMFGVENFVTQEPSDLEYDPQLRVVAEWRDHETLYKDRADNAVVDVMLEGAELGDQLGYDLYMLPLARVLKAYSVVLNQVGWVGPVREGMSATAALRNKWYSRKHRVATERLLSLEDQFRRENGYSPPYWELTKLARQAYSQ
jgi:hypothetical protein